MKINTKIMGEIEVADEKILTFENGIIGFTKNKHFALIHDEKSGNNAGIRWLQATDDESLAIPVMDPLNIVKEYNPVVEEEMLKSLGNIEDDNLLVLVTVTIPKDLTQMRINLKAPMVINVADKKGAQLILDNDEYPVKFPIYQILLKAKESNGKEA